MEQFFLIMAFLTVPFGLLKAAIGLYGALRDHEGSEGESDDGSADHELPEEGGPEIITASVRTPNHVTQAALMGADIATVPFAALKKCVHHPLADQGLVKFAADWKKVVEG